MEIWIRPSGQAANSSSQRGGSESSRDSEQDGELGSLSASDVRSYSFFCCLSYTHAHRVLCVISPYMSPLKDDGLCAHIFYQVFLMLVLERFFILFKTLRDTCACRRLPHGFIEFYFPSLFCNLTYIILFALVFPLIQYVLCHHFIFIFIFPAPSFLFPNVFKAVLCSKMFLTPSFICCYLAGFQVIIFA